MKYVDEVRDRAVAAALAERIKQMVHRPWTIMEVCGGQTHAIARFDSIVYCRKNYAGPEAYADQIIEVVGRKSCRGLPKCAHVFVLADEGVLDQHGRVLFSGGCDNDLISRISVKRLWQCRRSVAKGGGEGHGPELGHLECDTKPFFRIAGNPYPLCLQQLAEFPGRYR